jgi:hypothetical protein
MSRCAALSGMLLSASHCSQSRGGSAALASISSAAAAWACCLTCSAWRLALSAGAFLYFRASRSAVPICARTWRPWSAHFFVAAFCVAFGVWPLYALLWPSSAGFRVCADPRSTGPDIPATTAERSSEISRGRAAIRRTVDSQAALWPQRSTSQGVSPGLSSLDGVSTTHMAEPTRRSATSPSSFFGSPLSTSRLRPLLETSAGTRPHSKGILNPVTGLPGVTSTRPMS